MNNPQDDIELIERFFRQELSEEEMTLFENRVKQDPEFSKEVRFMRDIFYTVNISAKNNLREELYDIQKEALSEPIKPYNPNPFNWLKWMLRFIITGVIVGVGYYFWESHYIDSFKSFINRKDSTAVYDTIKTVPPAGSGTTMIKDPSDKRYSTIQADIHLEVKDPSTFKIKKLGTDEKGLYQYEITADGKTQTVKSDNPQLMEVLMKEKSKSMNNVIKDSISERDPDPIEGTDF